MANRNYWLFRVSVHQNSRIKFCLEHNLVYAGWNIGLSLKTPQEILEENPWASDMAINFCYINEGDVIIMPYDEEIAMGIAKNKQLREDLDWKDTINVEWLTKSFGFKKLTSNFQTKLKFSKTFLNLYEIKDEIESLISSRILSLSDK